MKNHPIDFGDEAKPEQELPNTFSSTIDVDVFAISDPGRVRANNEDHFLVARGIRALETVLTNLGDTWPGQMFDETAYAMIVADGVGGQAAGEVASRRAIYTLLDLALRTPDWQFRWGNKEKNTVMWRMQDRFHRVNAALLQEAAAHSALSGMCTTMTAALSHGHELIIGHVGDSRAYLLHEGELKRLTRDHTLAQDLIDDGINDPLFVELKGVLTQVLGREEHPSTPDIHGFEIADGDQLLLCTDGLTDMVGDSDIESILREAPSAIWACQNLVDRALSKGGHDNVTTIVARYRIPGIREELPTLRLAAAG